MLKLKRKTTSNDNQHVPVGHNTILVYTKYSYSSRWVFFDFVDSLCMFLSARNREKRLSVDNQLCTSGNYPIPSCPACFGSFGLWLSLRKLQGELNFSFLHISYYFFRFKTSFFSKYSGHQSLVKKLLTIFSLFLSGGGGYWRYFLVVLQILSVIQT